MRLLRYALGLALPMLMWQAVMAQPQRMSYSDTKRIIERIEGRADMFERDFEDDVDGSGVDSSIREDMKDTVDRFQQAADDLEDRYDKDNAAITHVRRLLREAAAIDSFMSQHIVSPRTQNEWLLLRQDMDMLANSYNLTANWPSALARAESPAPSAVVIVPMQPGSLPMQDLIRDIQADAATLQSDVRNALAGSPQADIQTGSLINRYLGDFMVSAERLHTSYSSGLATTGAANELLARAEPIDRYMKNHPLSVSAQESWIRLRNDLIRLAAAHNLSPAWLSR